MDWDEVGGGNRERSGSGGEEQHFTPKISMKGIREKKSAVRLSVNLKRSMFTCLYRL